MKCENCRCENIEGDNTFSKDEKKSLDSLKNNPIFSMSLGGKELFHSNFIAWLLESNNFPRVKVFFGINGYVYSVLREKNNLDLLVMYGENKEGNNELKSLLSVSENEIVGNDASIVENFKFVAIENKFKSLPHQDQLKKYNEKLSGRGIDTLKYKKSETISKFTHLYATINNTARLLFGPNSVLDTINDKCPEGWTKKTYEDFIKALEKDNKNQEPQTQTIVRYYIEMTKQIIEVVMPRALKDNSGIIPNPKIVDYLKGLRLHDIYIKLWYESKLSKFQIPVVHSSCSKMTHGTGLWEWKILYKEKLLYGVQIQHLAFEIFVEPLQGFSFLKNISEEIQKEIYEWGLGIITKLDFSECLKGSEVCVIGRSLNNYGDFKHVKITLPTNFCFKSLISKTEDAVKKLKEGSEEQTSLFNKLVEIL